MNEVRQEYVDARHVLLDALTGLHAHLDAFVLIGAQAVYLRTIDRIPGYQPFTTDADLVFDPERLADTPLLADAMTDAGFVFSGQPGIWHRTVTHPGQSDVTIPVDLIVPNHIAPAAGRRGARLPGAHGRTAAQKTVGVEGALVDHDPIEVSSLDPTDRRSVVVEVAGPAALLVAKAFKLGERMHNPRRFLPKDAGDIFRLYEANSVDEMLNRLRTVRDDERSAGVTAQAMNYLRSLFGTPRSPGIELAIDALGQVTRREDVISTMVDYTRELLATYAT